MTDKNAKNENSKIRIMTFFPPFIILVAFLVLALSIRKLFWESSIISTTGSSKISAGLPAFSPLQS